MERTCVLAATGCTALSSVETWERYPSRTPQASPVILLLQSRPSRSPSALWLKLSYAVVMPHQLEGPSSRQLLHMAAGMIIAQRPNFTRLEVALLTHDTKEYHLAPKVLPIPALFPTGDAAGPAHLGSKLWQSCRAVEQVLRPAKYTSPSSTLLIGPELVSRYTCNPASCSILNQPALSVAASSSFWLFTLPSISWPANLKRIWRLGKTSTVGQNAFLHVHLQRGRRQLECQEVFRGGGRVSHSRGWRQQEPAEGAIEPRTVPGSKR